MKLVSWNVNGIRACLSKGFKEIFDDFDADVFAIQETKMQEGQADLEFSNYNLYMNSAEKKGYSGTAVFSKNTPIKIIYGIGIPVHDKEGRVITLEFDDFYFITCYTPNSQNELKRLDYRMEWEEAFKDYIVNLDRNKPVILCGDLNVAHNEIDIKNPKANRRNAGFTDEEREKMTAFLKEGFVDSFRMLYPDTKDVYSWWSYRFSAREKNAGWRIDYFIVSERIKDKIIDAKIHTDIYGSDHCPVSLEIDI